MYVQKCGNRDEISHEAFRRYARSYTCHGAFTPAPAFNALTTLLVVWDVKHGKARRRKKPKRERKREKRAVSLGIVLLDY